MKKLLLTILIIIAMTGCINKIRPSDKVEYMLNKYIQNDDEIISELNTYLDMQELSKEQIERYKNIIKTEYSTLKYTIKDENIDENNANVEAEVIVKDLYKPSKEAQNYLETNPMEFYSDGIFDQDKFIDYKLNLMESSEDVINYLISFSLTKKDNVWELDDLSDDTLEKIHGIYNYDNEKP